MRFIYLFILIFIIQLIFRSLPYFWPRKINMSGGDVAPAGVELKGWAIKFNSYTKTGRANVAMATYGVIGAIVLYKKMTKKS